MSLPSNPNAIFAYTYVVSYDIAEYNSAALKIRILLPKVYHSPPHTFLYLVCHLTLRE